MEKQLLKRALKIDKNVDMICNFVLVIRRLGLNRYILLRTHSNSDKNLHPGNDWCYGFRDMPS